MRIVHYIYLAMLSMLLMSCGAMEAPTAVNTDNSPKKVQEVRRDSLPLTYYISSQMSDQAADEVKAAFAQWESDLNVNIFEFGGYINMDQKHINNQYHPLKNVIFETELSGKVEAEASDGYDALARTFVYGMSDIRDTDVVFYNFKKNFVEGRNDGKDIYSVKTVMIHEIGRMLFGSRGGDDESSVLNNPVYPKGHELEKTSLSAGDIDLFYRVYGDML